jgi:hypothetical protein
MPVIVAFAAILSACSGAFQQFDPAVVAQHNYDKALADYQNAAKRSVDACEQESQTLGASTKVLASFIAPGQ